MFVTHQSILFLGLFSFVYSASYVQRRNELYDFWPTNPNATTEEINGEVVYRVPRVRIGYIRDYPYMLHEFATLTNAMERIKTATKGCIQFVPYSLIASTSPESRLHIRNTPATGNISACRTHPGYYKEHQGAGQTIFLFGSTSKRLDTVDHGCLDDERETTRYLLNLLGVVNEYQRPDRASTGLEFPSGYNDKAKAYLRNEYMFYAKQDADWIGGSQVDPDSVTMITPEQYSESAADPVFTLSAGMTVNPSVSGRLSTGDCAALDYIYECGIQCGSSVAEIEMDPDDLVANFHCWAEGEAGQLISADDESRGIGTVGQLGPVTTVSGTGPIQYAFASSNSQLKIRSRLYGSTTDSVPVGLSRKIAKGFRTSAAVNGRRGGSLVATGDIEVWINCLPRFRINDALTSRQISCFIDGNQDIPALGLRNESTCTFTDNIEITVPCASGGLTLRPGTSIFRIEATDPDGDSILSELISVTSSENGAEEDDTRNWFYSSVTGAVSRGAASVSLDALPPFNFKVLFLDTTYSSSLNQNNYIIFNYDVALICQSPPTP